MTYNYIMSLLRMFLTKPTELNVSTPRSVIKIFVDIVLWVIALYFAIAAFIIPVLMGATQMAVLTGSMAPNIPPGYVVISQPVNPDDLKVGDVAVYMPSTNITNGISIIHRVNEIVRENGHVTKIFMKGDANAFVDAPINPSQISGKMAYFVPFMGYPAMLVHQSDIASLNSK